jgi:hypothetical protein
MYVYTKKALGMGTTQAQGRYTPARNVDPATGQPVSTEAIPVPWAAIDINVQNINCRFYENAPREMVLPQNLPYTMEVSGPGYRYLGACHPSQECPESVHQGVQQSDPLYVSRCNQWLEQWNHEATALIESEGFRRELTNNILSVANVMGIKRSLAKPAEFLEVVMEREARERPIKLISFVILAASGGILTFKAVRSAVKKRAKKRDRS